MHTLPLHAILTPTVFTVAPHTPLADVLAAMESLRISCVIAVDGEHHPLGIFTEQDAIRLMAERKPVNQLCMSDVMSAPPLTATGDIDFRDAYHLIAGKHYRHLVVVDSEGKLIGVVSEADFLHHMGMEYLVELKTVGSAMTRNLVTLQEEATLADAVDMMNKHKISCVIVTRDNKPLGILTERDTVALARHTTDPTRVHITQVMKSPVQTIEASLPLQKAIKQMEEANFRRLIVVEGGVLSGIVTRHDIVKTMQGRYYEFLHEMLERQRNDLHYAQTQIEQSRQQLLYHSLMEQVSDAIFVARADDGSIVDCNDQAGKDSGYSRDELLRMTLFDLATEIQAGERWQAELDIFEQASHRLIVTQHRRRDGSIFPVEINARLIHKGKERYIVAVVRDQSQQQASEQKLIASEQTYRGLLDSAGESIYVQDEDGHFLDVNGSVESMYGYTRDELIGKTPAFLSAPGLNDMAAVGQAIRLAISGVPQRFEFWGLRKNGEVFPKAVTLTRGHYFGRTVLIAVARDISSFKQIQLELQRSHANLEGILSALPDQLFEVDENGNVLFFHAPDASLLVAPPDQIIGRNIRDMLPPEVVELCATAMRAARSHGISSNHQYPLAVAKGELWFEFSVACKQGTPDTRPAFIFLVREITRNKQAEDAVKISRTMLQQVIDTAPLSIFWKDTHSRYLGCNESFARDANLPSAADIVGKDDFDMPWSGAEAAAYRADDAEVMAHDAAKKHIIESQLQADGSTIWLDTSKVPLKDAQGKIFGVLGIYQDITEKKRAEAQLALRESYLSAIIENQPGLVWLKDRAGTYLTVNQSFADAFGIASPALVVGKNDYDFSPKAMADQYRADDDKVMASGRSVSIEELVMTNDREVWHETFKTPTLNAEGEVIGTSGMARDISARKEAEEKIREMATVMQNTRDGVIITDTSPRILAINAAYTQITGYTLDEVVGKNPNVLSSGRQSQPFYEAMWHELLLNGHWQGEVWNRRKSGEIYPQWLSISSVLNDERKVTRYIGVFSDITKLKESQAQLEFMAHHDPLTKLPNRALVETRMTQEIEQAHRQKHRLSVLFIDLDRFKQVNDSFGHLVGDELLQAVSDRLRGRLREGDTLGRLGGDEFILLSTPLHESQDAAIIARDILAVLSEPFRLSTGNEVFIGGSIGISLFPDNGTTVSELTKNADAAMYEAKENGRNQFSFYTATLNADARNKLELENDLRRAMLHRELSLHFQPKVDMQSGNICGAEALARWQRDDGCWIPPAQFIPLAEKSGLILTIGHWVIEQTCQQLRKWLDDGITELCVAVNVSARQFRSGQLDHLISNALSKFSIPAACLEVELTESMLMHEPEQAIETMRKLKKIGVRISLDDFGTGYSNFGYLRRFPIDSLKVDQSFVRGAATDSDDAEITAAIISIAHRLRLRVVAEGVENAEQLAFLRANECNELQGYYFSKALPAGEFAALLKSGKTLG